MALHPLAAGGEKRFTYGIPGALFPFSFNLSANLYPSRGPVWAEVKVPVSLFVEVG
jgi:hypothetical protein